VAGLVVTALLLRHAGGDVTPWTTGGPLLLTLLPALAELARRRRRRHEPAPAFQPEHHCNRL
jgi:hypothetical protein